jgi:hypothetical protein
MFYGVIMNLAITKIKIVGSIIVGIGMFILGIILFSFCLKIHPEQCTVAYNEGIGMFLVSAALTYIIWSLCQKKSSKT